MTSLRDDVTFALRTLRKSPAFALTAVFTIALGIGATTSIFSVVNAVLLRSFPYANSDRLVFIQSDLTARNVPDFPMPPGDLPDLRRAGTLFDEVAAVFTNRQAISDETGEPELADIAGVTTNFFRTLGGRIIVGRDFVDADGAPPAPPPQAAQAAGGRGGPPPGAQGPAGRGGQAAAPAAAPPPPPRQMVVLSHAFWQRRFGGAQDVVGRTFRIGAFQTAEVIGVVDRSFELLWPNRANVVRYPDFYSAMRVDFENGSRVNVFLRAVARMKPGVSQPQAQAQIDGLVADLRQRFPVKETAGLKWRVEPMQQYVVKGVRPALVALMGAVFFVLLIACANVANLLLVRTSQRERELAVRAALGSGRWVLVRQMLVESLVIAVAGGAFGLALAWGGMRALIAVGPEDLPRLDNVGLDPTVVLFASGATVLAALLFGVIPALRASRVNVADILRSSGRAGALANAGTWLRNGVVLAEVALAFVLLIGSGLMMRSFVALYQAQPGYRSGGTLTFVLPNLGAQNGEEAQTLVRQIADRLAAVAGVTAVSAASSLPLEGVTGNARWGTEAALADPTLFQQADFRAIRMNYFDVLGTRLLEGRFFTEADNVQDTTRTLVIVDDVFARKAFPNESAVGKRYLSRTFAPEPTWHEIIGVVEHQRDTALAVNSREAMFVLDGGFGGANRWILRINGDPAVVGQAVRSELRQMNRNWVIANLQPLTALVDEARAPTRFTLLCIGVFAIVAAVLASVGLYGVLATSVRQRTAEIGVRMAFGADAGRIFTLVVRQGLLLALAGVVLGVAAAIGMTRLIRTMLVGVGTTDPITFAAVAALFLGLAAFASWVPARRASRLEPLTALREE